MYRILIVDNEPIIVDGLYHLFLEVGHLELDVHRAYSSAQALKLLEKHKIDIAFLDIHMPGMNGLDLQKKMQERWRKCKVIFQTGFNDFSYAQSALRHGVVDFVLKTEGDEKILESLDKAVEQLVHESTDRRQIEQAKRMTEQARPMLQKEFVLDLLYGERIFSESLELHFLELDFPLSLRHPVNLTLGRVDEWPEDMSGSDKTLLLYSIQNIAQEHLHEMRLFYLAYSHTHFIWLMQPKAVLDGEEPTTEAWRSAIAMVSGMLDSIQATCKELLKLPISLATLGTTTVWNSVAYDFSVLRQEMGSGLGLGQEVILSEAAFHPGAEAEPSQPDARIYGKNMRLLESYLESGNAAEFAVLCSEMLENASGSVVRYPHYLETYLSIAALLLQQWNKRGITGALPDKRMLDKLAHISEHATWRAAAEHFAALAGLMSQSMREDQRGRSDAVVDKLHRYISEHLHSDLSLNKLSEVVYLNPAYLSRLYKQTQGVGLADYISDRRIEKALELLRGISLLVQKIAEQVGLEPGYFIKMFKKTMKMTPQEYRESLLR